MEQDNTYKITNSSVKYTPEENKSRKDWGTPKLTELSLTQTFSGGTPGTPESSSQAPGS